MDLKQNALHNLWISPHKHCKSNQFFTINAQRGIYFFIYNVIRDTAFWIFFVSSRNYCTENIGNNVIVDPELLNLETFVISSVCEISQIQFTEIPHTRFGMTLCRCYIITKTYTQYLWPKKKLLLPL